MFNIVGVPSFIAECTRARVVLGRRERMGNSQDGQTEGSRFKGSTSVEGMVLEKPAAVHANVDAAAM